MENNTRHDSNPELVDPKNQSSTSTQSQAIPMSPSLTNYLSFPTQQRK
ncbi:hypothetical protein COLO4_22603 [Corchorus olitorius]|uniref:Uncharacterized protein n=1 Tax=Corchorus olitorius TaxID=93759 RepID=A0A1R3IL67_9ROSI|nr:hypothetical protein COLO4_22603 [Corchorus olitorius]